MEQSLGGTILEMRQEIAGLQDKVREMEARDINGGTMGLFTGMELHITWDSASTETLVAQVLAAIDLPPYTKTWDIPDPSSAHNLDNLVGELKEGGG